VIPDRTYRRLDRDRLDRRTLRSLGRPLAQALHELRTGHGAYRDGGRVLDLKSPAQRLLDTLNGAFELEPKRVFLRDSPRPHKRRKGRIVYEVHGLCDPAGPIEAYTRTAARGQPVALKTLLDTLLHEWVHHYDFCRHGESVHCTGFYERLSQLYRPSRDWIDKVEQEAAG
jgi:hypothetical protein